MMTMMMMAKKRRVENSESREIDAQLLSAQLLADVVLVSQRQKIEPSDMTVTRAAAYIIQTIRRK